MHHRLALNLIGSLGWDQISSPPLLSRGVLGLQVNAITLVRDQEILLFIFSSVPGDRIQGLYMLLKHTVMEPHAQLFPPFKSVKQ